MNLHVTNVVISASVQCNLNLRNIAHKLANVIYNPHKYSGLIWQHRKIKSKCFLFHTGKMLCMGNDNLAESKKDLRKYARILYKLKYPVCISNIKLVTQSAVATLSGRLDIANAVNYVKGTYDPELFNALMIRSNRIHYTCFSSGKVIITGVRNLNLLTVVLCSLELFTL